MREKNILSYIHSGDRYLGFPDSSADKEATCNVGDMDLIPGPGRSPGEGIGYPLQDSWALLCKTQNSGLCSKEEKPRDPINEPKNLRWVRDSAASETTPRSVNTRPEGDHVKNAARSSVRGNVSTWP